MFAFHLCCESCFSVTNALPSESLGREVFKILKRSDDSPEKVHDRDFYQCEIFFTNNDPVGIMALFSNEKTYRLDYVSPMIVKKTTEQFKDSNSVICNVWLPLYKDKNTWKNYNLSFYVHELNLKKIQLLDILLWLKIQTAEKYKLIRMDLLEVGKILFGGDDESRWYLKR